MNNNYILARWRDVSTDPPVSGWIGLNIMANGARYYGACGYMPGDQWLDITDRPGVAREAVQAAVDEIGLELDETGWSVSEYSCTLREGIEDALKIIEHHTGVTPKEVTNG
jgi:hypothetical protein